MSWFAHVLGLDDGTSSWYLWWSGFGSDLTEFALIGTLWTIWRHHNCAVPRCVRIGRHEVDGTGHRTCHRHTTRTHHDALYDSHEADHPEQHELLSRR